MSRTPRWTTSPSGWSTSPASSGQPEPRLTVLRVPGGDLGAAGEAELDEDVLHVALHGSLGEHQAGGDLLVGQALGDQPGDLALAAGQSRLVVELPGGWAGAAQRVGDRLVERQLFAVAAFGVEDSLTECGAGGG